MWESRFAALCVALTGCGGGDFGSTQAADVSADSGPIGNGGAKAVAAGSGGSGTGGATVIANPLCTPGASVACVGAAACAGGQTCKADGSGFGECACAAPEKHDAGPTVSPTTKSSDGSEWVCKNTPDYSVCMCFLAGQPGATACGAADGPNCHGGRCVVGDCCTRTVDKCQCVPLPMVNGTCAAPEAPAIHVASCP